MKIANEINNLEQESEIDFKEIKNLIFRNKKLITKTTLISVIIFSFYALTTKRTWEGSFQIVLQQDSNTKLGNSILNQLSSSSPYFNLTPQQNKIATEVEILQSPSVLLETFEFVKETNQPKKKSLLFKDWKEKLNIKLTKNTSVLNISYRDQEKETILPVLHRISKAYQNYSGKKKLKKVTTGINFLKDQISIFETKAAESMREKELFGRKNNIDVVSTSSLEGDNQSGIFILTNVEEERLRAQKKVRIFEEHEKKINDIQDSEEILYVAETLTDIKGFSDLTSIIKEIDKKLAFQRAIYKDSDESIKDLLKEKSIQVELSKRQILGLLKAHKEDAISTLKSTERSQDTIIKFKQLVNKSIKNQEILNELENQYRVNLLEKARTTEPWDLITKPTLFPYSVAPNKKRLLALGIILGSITGILLSFLIEKKKGYIYSLNELKSLSNYPILASISLDKDKSWRETVSLIAASKLSNLQSNIAILKVGLINDSAISKIYKSLSEEIKEDRLLITDKVKTAASFGQIMLIAELGSTRSYELETIKSKLLLQNSPILGLLIVNGVN
tara:strand:- start:32198 stop:33883 length:1686 start_codon:yes stop_codon:yes gene_type:complete